MKNTSNKITALTDIDENISIVICANGYSLEVSGKNAKDDWVSVRYVVSSFDSLLEMLTEVDQRCRTSRGY